LKIKNIVVKLVQRPRLRLLDEVEAAIKTVKQKQNKKTPGL
jgi:hypothetical protein